MIINQLLVIFPAFINVAVNILQTCINQIILTFQTHVSTSCASPTNWNSATKHTRSP